LNRVSETKEGRNDIMGLFGKKVIKQVKDGAWGHLISVHKVDVDTISNSLRCVEQAGLLDGNVPVIFLRVFRPIEAEQKGIVVTGWETFDQHPDLIVFEGYLTKGNDAHLERKKP
jgi:hypothetical protein